MEDSVAALRIVSDETMSVQQAVSSADRSLAISTAQCKAETTSYLTVITAQANALSAVTKLDNRRVEFSKLKKVQRERATRIYPRRSTSYLGLSFVTWPRRWRRHDGGAVVARKA